MDENLSFSLRLQCAKNELLAVLGADNCLCDPAEKILYGYDHSCISHQADVVTLPNSTAQVQAIINIANKYKLPIIPRGQATNTCGAVVPINGGIVIATQNLNRIIEINHDDKYAIVQSGVINNNLQLACAQFNLFWPPDPGSAKICTIGGNLACNSAGPSAVKYGVTRDHTLGITFVTGYGEIIKTGVYTTKGVAGYDLTRLLIGSEGTLGFITEAVLKLTPKPEITHTIQANYDSISSATQVITNIMRQSVIPSALEILDLGCLNLIKDNQLLDIPDNSQAMLIIEAGGSKQIINQDSDILYQLANTKNCLNIKIAKEDRSRAVLWQARKSLSPKLRYIAPKKINEDIAVPISKLPELILFINKLSENYAIPIVNFGHAGNGNIHVNLLINPENIIENQNAQICLDKLFNKVIALRGTISGEHGIGLTKFEYLRKEIDNSSLNLFKQIKSVFDPNNILNAQLMNNL